MANNQTLSEQRIIDALKSYFEIEVDKLIFLPLGADSNASVFKIEVLNHSPYFVKLLRDHQDISVTIVELLHNAGIQYIIPPIKTTQGQSSQRVDDFTLIVYPFIEGQNGFDRPLTDQQWLTLGTALREIHEMHVPASIQNKIRHEGYSSQWREIVRSLYDIKPSDDTIALKLWAFMQAKKQTIYRLVDRAEQLAEIMQNESPMYVLCHTDIHGGNILMNNNNNFFIVDWDDPIMAPKERDLMFIGGGIGNGWDNPHNAQQFYKGYGKVEINNTILAYYRHERIVEDIAIYGQDLLLASTGGANRSIIFQHFVNMFEPSGVIKIAFETDTKSNK